MRINDTLGSSVPFFATIAGKRFKMRFSSPLDAITMEESRLQAPRQNGAATVRERASQPLPYNRGFARGQPRGRGQCPEPLGNAMQRTSWNMSGNYPASGDVRRVSSLLLLALLVLVSWTSVRAAEPSVRPFRLTSSTPTAHDIEIEINVLRALRKDAQLKPLNLGVRMVGGVARLSGPVPSQELKQRVLTIVGRVYGVLQVNARDLYVSTSTQGSNQMAVLIPDEQPTQTRSASPHALSRGTEPLPALAVSESHTPRASKSPCWRRR